MRKNILFAIVCFLTLSLCGCTAINYFVCENEDGNISYGAIFVFEEDKFNSTEDYNEAKEYTTTKLTEQGLLVLEKARQIEGASEDENFKINVIAKLNAVDISSFATISDGDVNITNSNSFEKIKQSNEIVYSVVFKTMDDYSAFNSGSSSAETTPIKEKKFFEIKNGNKRTYDFGATIESLSYIDEIKARFASYLKDGGDINYNYINFSYTYITPHKQIKSNATLVEKTGGLFYHTWNVDQNTMKQDVEIYARYPNPLGYYVTSLVVSVGVVLAMLITNAFKSFVKHKNYNIEK